MRQHVLADHRGIARGEVDHAQRKPGLLQLLPDQTSRGGPTPNMRRAGARRRERASSEPAGPLACSPPGRSNEPSTDLPPQERPTRPLPAECIR